MVAGVLQGVAPDLPEQVTAVGFDEAAADLVAEVGRGLAVAAGLLPQRGQSVRMVLQLVLLAGLLHLVSLAG